MRRSSITTRAFLSCLERGQSQLQEPFGGKGSAGLSANGPPMAATSIKAGSHARADADVGSPGVFCVIFLPAACPAPDEPSLWGALDS
mmetsp:Transcript_107322/g.346344  ORF Transcript_107322/g.346344 Transcript_107322/m.346344 type:complete len:88 (+) Transcript_107322:384-647(+)